MHKMFLLLLLVASPAVAVAAPGSVDSQWGARTYTPVDPAGSKGSQSLALGLSTIAPSATSDATANRESGRGNEPLMRLHLTKGLPVPFDFGLVIGSTGDGLAQQAGGHLQWTIYEGFRMPALSLRSTLMRTYLRHTNNDPQGATALAPDQSSRDELTGLSTGDARTLDFAGSWGLFGILTPYAGAGWITVDDARSFQRMAGLEIQLAPPFARASIEARKSFNSSVIAAKVSLGL